MIVLSHIQTAPLLNARRMGRDTARISLDLNRTETDVALTPEGVGLPDGKVLLWQTIEEINETETACFIIENGAAEKIQFYSEALNRFYSLYPTEGAPTMMLSGIPMHRIKTIDPHEDTMRKMKTIGATGRVLDVCTGLGYTAIAAAKTAEQVVTIELDPTVLEVARRNPWSQALFDNPKVEQRIGDALEVVQALRDESFSRIFHDPPTFKLAGDLYSGEMYRHLHRVLKRGGRLFHYIGDLDSTTGRVVAKGAVRRLQEAGFARIERRPEAFGLTAHKN